MTSKPTPSATLQDVRARIDRIDQDLHRLMVERTELASEVWSAKDRSVHGLAALRPAREAQMLRALAKRHRGDMPLAVLWRIWRELIVANIRAQSFFSVHVAIGRDSGNDGGTDGQLLWDAARAHFGFETDMTRHRSSKTAIRTATDDGAVAVLPTSGFTAWAGEISASTKTHVFGVLAQIEPSQPARTGPFEPVAYLVGDVALEPSGADTTVVLVDACTDEARAAAQACGHSVTYCRSTMNSTMLGIAGMPPPQLPLNGGKWGNLNVIVLGVHADPLVWKSRN